MRANTNNKIKKSVDVCMTLLLLCLMAYQVTGEAAHEWLGIGETALVVIHQILNRKWYSSLFKGKYNPYRVVTTALSALLIGSFLLTALGGMSMSGHAVPFLYGMTKVSFARMTHLSMSHWSFVLMGLHLGLHIPAMLAKFKPTDKTRNIISAVFALICGYGLYLFISGGVIDYLFFKTHFAFMDYDKPAALVFIENLLMLVFWAFAGSQGAELLRDISQKNTADNNKQKISLLPIVFILAAVAVGLVCVVISAQSDNGGPVDWSGAQAQNSLQTPAAIQSSDNNGAAVSDASDDGFILVQSGTFMMGSPETENWRIDDETQHEVTVSGFYIASYETTQEEYESLMGTNPSTFLCENYPVDNISWTDAILFANAKSKAAGLNPAYTVTENGVSWDRSANGYRLPTEAEWEYACRAGTTTPFNAEKSLDATEANFYGHYPYEIEENYFNDSVLEARPGEYRQTTMAVGCFEPNAWGLYDCHGNVNEWCWDYYGEYDLSVTADPTGAVSGTRHIYRGGGWNDFAKNMRSAYRAAGQSDMKSYNLGVRLVRNADSSLSGTVTSSEDVHEATTAGKILISYFSWSGNTRGIAREIQRRTGADIFEISPVDKYSTDYNTVLMEAQEDQHRQARPELDGLVENMDQYDIIILGYPNWWASIPMPVASFLEEYDLSGKRILPFCSHGGGRFGQSLTAIAKLAPESDMGEGLSIHYSGGASLSDDVAEWLAENGIR